MPGTSSEFLAGRLRRYLDLCAELDADGAVLTSEASVAHATGIHLYTHHLLPERPIAAVLGPSGTRLVCCEYELAQVAAAQPALPLVGFPEFGADPWAMLAEAAQREIGHAARVLVEPTCPAPGVHALEAAGMSVRVDAGFDGLLRARMAKDADEISALASAAREADVATVGAVSQMRRESSERLVAAGIQASFATRAAGTAEGSGIVAGVRHNAAMHHLASDDPIAAGPVRVGLKAQIDGYWMIVLRMATFGDESPEFRADYGRFADAYQHGIDNLRVGCTGDDVYRAVRDRLAANGLGLASLKVGHGTGLGFREPPLLRLGDNTVLTPGTVLAYDFAVEAATTRSGLVLHVEDRVLVRPEGPVRLSDVSDLAEPLKVGG